MKNNIFLILLILVISLINIGYCNGDSGINKYYSLTTDVRRCAAPMCGGYFLQELNSNSERIYVGKLTQVGGRQVDENKFRNVPNDHIIVFGSIVGSGFTNEIQTTSIFRLLTKPSEQFDIKKVINQFYIVIQNNRIALNRDGSFGNYNVSNADNSYYHEIPLIQEDWLELRLKSGNAIFTSNNDGKTIDNIFVQLPDPYMCPLNLVVVNCEASQPGSIPTYTRNANRCQSFTGCVKRLLCSTLQPVCPNEYSLVSFNSKPNGCLKHYCDPSFL